MAPSPRQLLLSLYPSSSRHPTKPNCYRLVSSSRMHTHTLPPKDQNVLSLDTGCRRGRKSFLRSISILLFTKYVWYHIVAKWTRGEIREAESSHKTPLTHVLDMMHLRSALIFSFLRSNQPKASFLAGSISVSPFHLPLQTLELAPPPFESGRAFLPSITAGCVSSCCSAVDLHGIKKWALFADCENTARLCFAWIYHAA